ncbi:hypothetical protein [Actinomadura rugatobispora]|uniref:Sigma-70 family RNA polymerase sigma factor n=1 Tax=Actinomadura rugatobispora TaxID=1994 RepID=A0ABW1AIS1_9ACTN|nr:hypothetical protein GCM10010200_047000 [Actinomadura rugatobispora]
MPRHPDPPHGDDRRLAEELRERRPGAVGHVYNVYGPQLFEYAHGLLGDRDLAVEAVRAALLAGRDGPDAVPGPERFRTWLYGLVQDECLGRLEDESTGAAPTVTPPAGAAEQRALALAVQRNLPVAESSVLVGPPRPDGGEGRTAFAAPAPDMPPEFMAAAALEGTSNPQDPGPTDDPVQALVALATPQPDPTALDAHQAAPLPEPATPHGTPVAGEAHRKKDEPSPRVHRARLLLIAVGSAAAVVLTGLLIIAQMPDDGPPPAGAAAAPGTTAPPVPPPSATAPSATPEPKKTKKPERRTTTRPASSGRPRLVIGDSGCRSVAAAGLGGRCSIRLTARGGTVRWSVSSVSGTGVFASGGGTLSSGRSTSVTVTVRPSIRCYTRGGGTGSVAFSPGGQASVSYTCRPG